VSSSNQFVQSGQTPWSILWSLTAGFLAWGANLGFSYVLAQHACSTGHHYVLSITNWSCFFVALTGVFAGWNAARKLPHDKQEQGRRPHDRAHFQSLLGMILSAAISVVIVAGAVPPWILRPCD